MKLDEMKVQYERSRDGFTHESDFAVKTEKALPKVNVSGIAVKVGLCAGVLALAFIVRAFGVGAPKTQVVEASSHADGTTQAEQTPPGRLSYAEATGRKWAAPVRAYDVELMLEGQLLRFTAGASTVSSCMNGTVLSVGTDENYGSFVRVQSENDVEAIYYGFDTITVKENEQVQAGDVLGTVSVGRSMYLRVFEKGAPQDPTVYVDLSLKNE